MNKIIYKFLSNNNNVTANKNKNFSENQNRHFVKINFIRKVNVRLNCHLQFINKQTEKEENINPPEGNQFLYLPKIN